MKKKAKKVLALFLTVTMLIGMVPGFATEISRDVSAAEKAVVFR